VDTIERNDAMHPHHYERYKLELHVEEIQNDYLRANGAPHLRHARVKRSRLTVAVVTGLRVPMNALLVSAHIRQKPVIFPEPVTDPADTTVPA
jgi:hypothetical protein